MLEPTTPSTEVKDVKLQDEVTQSNLSISTTDTCFQDAAFDSTILDPDISKPHTNLKSRQERIDRSRDTPSPSESEYRKIAHKIRTACNEQTLLL